MAVFEHVLRDSIEVVNGAEENQEDFTDSLLPKTTLRRFFVK